MKRFILWDYRRASWQYDVMVALILAFIFLTPRAWFRDQPRASSIVMLPNDHGPNVYWVDPELMSGLSGAQRLDKAKALFHTQKRQEIVRLEPIFDSEQEIRGYMAYTK
jgi:hypothetical protein